MGVIGIYGGGMGSPFAFLVGILDLGELFDVLLQVQVFGIGGFDELVSLLSLLLYILELLAQSEDTG